MDKPEQPITPQNNGAAPVDKVPQPHGGALNRGGTPNNAGGSGRPTKSFTLRCQYLAEQAIRTVEAAEILKDRNDPLFMETAKWVAERGFGKAPQPITGADLGPIQTEDVGAIRERVRNRITKYLGEPSL